MVLRRNFNCIVGVVNGVVIVVVIEFEFKCGFVEGLVEDLVVYVNVKDGKFIEDLFGVFYCVWYCVGIVWIVGE